MSRDRWVQENVQCDGANEVVLPGFVRHEVTATLQVDTQTGATRVNCGERDARGRCMLNAGKGERMPCRRVFAPAV